MKYQCTAKNLVRNLTQMFKKCFSFGLNIVITYNYRFLISFHVILQVPFFITFICRKQKGRHYKRSKIISLDEQRHWKRQRSRFNHRTSILTWMRRRMNKPYEWKRKNFFWPEVEMMNELQTHTNFTFIFQLNSMCTIRSPFSLFQICVYSVIKKLY